MFKFKFPFQFKKLPLCGFLMFLALATGTPTFGQCAALGRGLGQLV
jgi:hypothetical protein